MNNPDRTTKEYRMRWWILAVVAISVINVVFDTTIVNIALPTFQRELGTTQSELQWIVISYMIVFGSLMLITGSLGDRWGRARMLLIGLFAYAGASLAASFSSTGAQLIFWRVIMGIGGAMILPATLAIITNVFPREEQGKAIGIWAGVNSIGIAVGPILAGLIIEHLNWGWVFLINVPLAIVAIVAGFFLIPNSRNPNPKKLDILGAILSTSGLAALIYGLTEGGSIGWTEYSVISTLLGGIVLLALFVLWEKRTAHPLLEMDFFKKPRFSVGIIALCLMALAMLGINFTLTLFMQFVQVLTPLATGIRFIPFALGIFIGAGIADKVVAKAGTTKVVAFGFLGIAFISALAGFCQADTPYWQLGLIIFGWGISLGCIAASATDAVMGTLPKAQAGIGSGMTMVGRMVAGSIGTVLVSILSTVYSANFKEAAAAIPGLASEIVEPASESVGAAVSIAQQLPDEMRSGLIQIANDSFMDGWQVMAFIVCGVSLISLLIVFKFMPPRDETVEGELPAVENQG